MRMVDQHGSSLDSQQVYNSLAYAAYLAARVPSDIEDVGFYMGRTLMKNLRSCGKSKNMRAYHLPRKKGKHFFKMVAITWLGSWSWTTSVEIMVGMEGRTLVYDEYVASRISCGCWSTRSSAAVGRGGRNAEPFGHWIKRNRR